jgi:hypothetical protein
MNGRILRILCLPAAAGWLLAGCGQGGSQSPKPRPWWDQDDPAPASKAAPTHRAEESSNPLAALFGPPASSGGASDGNYTVLLSVCRGPGSHINQAKYYKTATEQHAGWKYLFIVHKESHSLLCWGKYEKVADARENLEKAKVYRTPANLPVYAKAIIVPLPGKEDPGPREWDLAGSPEKFVYTVLVAEFHDVPEANYVGRKKFAVDYCRHLRDEGVEAYYKHDPQASIVTIGLFEPAAVTVVKQGEKFQRVPRDARISAIFKRFRDLAVNGRQKLIATVNPKTGKTQKMPAPTYLMLIPREQIGSTPWGAAAQRSPAPQPPAMATCELKIVRVSDGAVLAAVSGTGRTDDLPNLARMLVQKLEKGESTKGKPLAVASLRNRSGTRQSAVASNELGYKTMAALLEEGWFAVKERVWLRKLLPEKDLEDPAIVKAPKVRQRLSGLDYVVLGGVAVSQAGGT